MTAKEILEKHSTTMAQSDIIRAMKEYAMDVVDQSVEMEIAEWDDDKPNRINAEYHGIYIKKHAKKIIYES